MTPLDPAAVIRQLFARADSGDDGFVDDLYATDYRDHTPSESRAIAPGREGVRQAFALFRRAFPDVRHDLHDLLVDGDRVAVRLTAYGTHRGELFGIPPSGRLVSQSGIAIYRVVAGRIVERWAYAGSDLLAELRAASVVRPF